MMNEYLVKTTIHKFYVEAIESDAACLAANTEIADRDMPIPNQRAELYLVTSSGEVLIGTFELKGVPFPKTWGEMNALRTRVFEAAKKDSHKNWDLPVVRSRGAVLVVEDGKGKTLIATGDCYQMPRTQKGYNEALNQIRSMHPSARRVWLCIGCDGAESVKLLNDGDYTPWSGEAQALIHEFESCVA
ncbi:hypothetical protein ACUZ8Y_22605 [Aeromonas veronii]|uniref:hypothetical protein n=1 Tax=Aeromonas veronii TaxID=654 RepID=UPI00406BC1B0